MASLPTGGMATGLVDSSGRLVSADSLIAQLQEEAGSRIGASLAVPQLAAIARLVRKLGISVSRSALAGSRTADLELWVRAEPEEDSVRLTIERWTERPIQPRRWPEDGSPEAKDEAGFGFELNRELKLSSLSPALGRKLGPSADLAVGAPITRLVRLEPDEDGGLPLLGAVAARQNFRGQRAILQADPEVQLLLSGQPIEAADGTFAGFRGEVTFVGADGQPIGEPAPAFDELLRQPLDAIISEAEHIAGRSEGPLRSDYAAYASDIAAAGRHLVEVLRSMNSEPLASHDRVDVAQLAAEAIGLVQAQAAERHVLLAQDGVTELAARGQARAITQILVNLIGNAVRYSPEGGTVRITVSSGEAASVTVADQGPGVAEADRERIFERFEQAEPRGEGAGLGLAISRRLARSLGGDICLESRAGEGARFTLTLPLT